MMYRLDFAANVPEHDRQAVTAVWDQFMSEVAMEKLAKIVRERGQAACVVKFNESGHSWHLTLGDVKEMSAGEAMPLGLLTVTLAMLTGEDGLPLTAEEINAGAIENMRTAMAKSFYTPEARVEARLARPYIPMSSAQELTRRVIGVAENPAMRRLAERAELLMEQAVLQSDDDQAQLDKWVAEGSMGEAPYFSRADILMQAANVAVSLAALHHGGKIDVG